MSIEEKRRDAFLKHLVELVEYWDGIEKPTKKENLRGLVFSILATIDGATPEIPAMELVTEDGISINKDVALHEFWYKYKKLFT